MARTGVARGAPAREALHVARTLLCASLSENRSLTRPSRGLPFPIVIPRDFQSRGICFSEFFRGLFSRPEKRTQTLVILSGVDRSRVKPAPNADLLPRLRQPLQANHCNHLHRVRILQY